MILSIFTIIIISGFNNNNNSQKSPNTEENKFNQIKEKLHFEDT